MDLFLGTWELVPELSRFETGTPQPLPAVAGAPVDIPDAFTVTRVDERTLDSAALCRETRVAPTRRVASRDGSLLAVVQEAAGPDGGRMRNFQAYRRVSS